MRKGVFVCFALCHSRKNNQHFYKKISAIALISLCQLIILVSVCELWIFSKCDNQIFPWLSPFFDYRDARRMQEREEAWHRIFDKAFENPDVSMKAMVWMGPYIKKILWRLFIYGVELS